MARDPKDGDLESHLADRLKETKDFANFSRRRPDAGTPEGAEVSREITIEGAEHLGGRKISDKFVRSRAAAPLPTAGDDEEGSRREKGLEHHLKSRLAEIEDRYPAQGTNRLEESLSSYRELRKKLGGS